MIRAESNFHGVRMCDDEDVFIDINSGSAGLVLVVVNTKAFKDGLDWMEIGSEWTREGNILSFLILYRFNLGT